MTDETCPYCDEPISESDTTSRMNFYTQARGPHQRTVHFECDAVRVIGSVGHQLEKCSCYGGTEDDPPGLTKREAAKAALELARKLMGRREFYAVKHGCKVDA